MSNYYQPPPSGGQPRPMGGGMQPGNFGPPGSTSPSAGAQHPPGGGFGQPFGRPPATGGPGAGGNFPPPSGMGGGGPPMGSTPRGGPPPPTGGGSMQFYSTASGAPRPATLPAGPPPSNMGGAGGMGGMGGMPPPPPSNMGGSGMGGNSPPVGQPGYGPPGGGASPGVGAGAGGGWNSGPPMNGGRGNSPQPGQPGQPGQFQQQHGQYSQGGPGGNPPQSSYPGMGMGGGGNPYGPDNSGGGVMGGGMAGPSPRGPPGGQFTPTAAMAGGFSGGFQGQQQPGMGNQAGSGPQQPGMEGQGAHPGGELPSLDDMDTSIECNPKYMRASVAKLLNNRDMLVASKLPVGVVCQPMASHTTTADAEGNNDPIEVVDFGSTGIVRCKRCRAYINPYVTWNDNGRRWRCNLCGMLNDVPSSYFSHLDQNGQRRDKMQRPELCNASVELMASGDYMVRPPQPPVYFFVIDVSCISNQSGMLQCLVNSVKAALDDIPGKTRAQIGFMTFDSTIHYYSLKYTMKAPQMLVVSDLSDGGSLQPLPEDLLVNIEESRDIIMTLLDSLPHMFSGNNSSSNNMASINTCTGPALMSAMKIIQHVGGKLLLFQTTLPSIGEGTLKPRENPRLLGTDKEHMMLNAEDPWYRNIALEFSKLQIAVDTFIFSAQYADVATISTLSKLTAGSAYYYPAFDSRRDGTRFERDLTHNLTRTTGFEAVFRIRATRGVHVNQFYGNHTIRGSDLLALPNVTCDSVFGCELTIEDNVLQTQVIAVQSALLYTNAAGERRICLHTMIIPTCSNLHDMLETVDMDCTLNIMTKQSIDLTQKVGFDQGRSRVHGIAVGVLQAAQGKLSNRMHGAGYQHMPSQQQQQQERPIPDSLKLLPLYAMALQKSLALRGGHDVRVDERAYYHNLASNMNVDDSKVFIYPRMFSIHDMETDVGLPVDNNEVLNDPSIQYAGPDHIKLPNILNLSHDRLDGDGIILLDNGHDLFMWMGRNVNPALLTNIFGISTLDGSVDLALLEIQSDSCDFAHRLMSVVNALRSKRHRYMQLTFMREGDGYSDAFFSRYLVEDRANFPGGSISYAEYYGTVTRPSAGYGQG